LEFLKTCVKCTARLEEDHEQNRAKCAANKENEREKAGKASEPQTGNHHGPTPRTHAARTTLLWADFTGLLEKHSKNPFELDALLELPDEDEAEILTDDSAQTAKNIAKHVWDLAGYQFM
jgi:hypothetical protein